jgi:hypothetical protein
MLQIHTQIQRLTMGLMFVALSTPLCAHAGEPPLEMRCLGMYKSQGIGVPSDVQVSDPGQAEQYLVMDDAHLTIQDSDGTDIEYSLCKTTDAQRQYSNQCGLTPNKFITKWRAIGKWISAPKGQGTRPKTLPLSVDHVEVDRDTMAIRWTHLTRNVIASKGKRGATKVYFVGSEFSGKCERAQMVL